MHGVFAGPGASAEMVEWYLTFGASNAISGQVVHSAGDESNFSSYGQSEQAGGAGGYSPDLSAGTQNAVQRRQFEERVVQSQTGNPNPGRVVVSMPPAITNMALVKAAEQYQRDTFLSNAMGFMASISDGLGNILRSVLSSFTPTPDSFSLSFPLLPGIEVGYRVSSTPGQTYDGENAYQASFTINGVAGVDSERPVAPVEMRVMGDQNG